MSKTSNRRAWRAILFVVLTFALSWGFDLLLTAVNGGVSFPELSMTPWGMVAPAFVALVLQVFAFRDSPIHFRALGPTVRWILYSYLLLTPVYGMVTLLAVALPAARAGLQGMGAVALTVWTMLVLFLGGQSDPEARQRAGLSLGNVTYGQRFVLGAVAFILSQAGLNLLFGLGELQGKQGTVYGLPIPASWYVPALAALFISVSVIGAPLSGLAAVFGEEYGWRGYLQGSLTGLGKAQSALVVGLVWGVWHVPVILRGAHTYPPTWLGVLLGIVFFVLWGLVQSYAVLKTSSIWVAAFVHGVVNSVYAFTISYIVRPRHSVLSFGLGVYGLACLGILVGAILRDPIWRDGC